MKFKIIKKSLKKINKTKSLFLEKYQQSQWTTARLTKKKLICKLQISEMKEGHHYSASGHKKYSQILWTIRCSPVHNLDIMDQFLARGNLPKHIQKDTDNINKYIPIKKLKKQLITFQYRFTCKIYQTLTEEIITIL